MAKLALTVGGALIGFAIGGPFGAQIGAMIGGMVGNILFAPTIKGPRLTDLTVTASTYGQVIPELYGTMRLGGNLIWTSGIKEKKKKSGGKGGPKQVTYTYSASFAVGFCKGAVDGLLRIWADGKLIAGKNPEEDATGEIIDSIGILKLTDKKKTKVKYAFYVGDEAQQPDSTIVAKEGSGKVPGYRGLAYIVFKDMQLENFGNRIPQITAEITRNPIPAVPYVNLQAETPIPSWFGLAGAQADWENQRFYKFDFANQELVTFDTRTMQELFRVPVQDTGLSGFPSNHKPSFSCDGAYFFDDISDSNSGYNCFWSAKTGAFLGYFGFESTALSQDPMGSHTHPFDPHLAFAQTFGRSDWFRVLTGDGSTSENLVVVQGNVSDQLCIWSPGLYPVYFTSNGVGTPGVGGGGNTTYDVIRGKEVAPELPMGGVGNSDLILIMGGFANILCRIINIPELSIMGGLSDPPYAATNPILASDTLNFEIIAPGGEPFEYKNGAYDKSDNSIVFWGTSGGDWRFGKWLIDEQEWAWYWKDTDYDSSWMLNDGNGAFPTGSAVQSNLNGGTVGWIGNDSALVDAYVWVADLQTGRLTLKIDNPLTIDAMDGFSMGAFDDDTQSILGAPTRIFIGQQSEGVSLQTIVDDLLLKTGVLTPGVDWDSDELAPIIVRGYSIAREATVRDCLQQLAGAYFFDGVESDYIIKCKLRGGAPIASITEKHLGFIEGRDITIKETRAQELELPMRVTITYADYNRDYQDGTQAAKRNTNPFPTMHSHNEVKFELPIAMTATEAKQIADKSLKMAWANRWSYRLRLPWEFLKYDPTDILTITSDEGFSYQMRFDKMDLGVDFTIETDAASEKPAAYTSVAVGSPGSGVPVQVINTGGPVNLYILNTPLLRDSDDTQGVASVYYATATAKSPGDYGGCYVFKGDPTGTDYEDIGSIPIEPTWGDCQTILPSEVHYGLDPYTILKVRMMSMTDDENAFDTLSSCTSDDLLAGKNAALVGNEIIQFQTAELQPDGRTYHLTNLLRNRRGTNYTTITHKADESFVLLDLTTIIRNVNVPSEWEAIWPFKGIAPGEFVENVPAQVLDMDPNDLKPYTPECVITTDDGTDVTLTFERRSRIGNELTDGTADVPYREGQGSLAHFKYRVYVNQDLLDEPWADEIPSPDFEGTVPIYSGMSFATLTFDFPLAGVTEFVAEIWEVGFVEGFPKIIHFVREAPNDWAKTELY